MSAKPGAISGGEGLHRLGVAALAAKLRAREVSAVELAQAFFARIDAHAELNAFVARDEEATLAQARVADERLARGDAAPLLGVPIAHKDAFVTRQWPTSAGSKMLQGYISPFDAAVVERLGGGGTDGAPGAGCVTMGKLNCDEFAMGSTNESSVFGPVRNPWDRERVPGGSSGGSAAAVAARLLPAATGRTPVDRSASLRATAASPESSRLTACAAATASSPTPPASTRPGRSRVRPRTAPCCSRR